MEPPKVAPLALGQQLSARARIVQHCNAAARELASATALASATNPLSPRVPELAEIVKMHKRLIELMAEINKMPGL